MPRFEWFASLIILAASLSTLRGDEPATTPAANPGVFRLGIIGTTTSHVNAFVNILNDPKREGLYREFEVVGAYPGGMPDNPASWGRVEAISRFVAEKGIAVYSTIEEMLPHVDGVLLESVDGRCHLEQARPVIAAGKPLYIDKPAAASLADALEIYRLAKEKNVPLFSSSSLRFSSGFQQVRGGPDAGNVLGATTWSPSSRNPLNPGLFWYGIHGVETLFTIMGPGCESVSCIGSNDYDLASGIWGDGRIGTFRGDRRGKGGYGATIYTAKGAVDAGKYEGYKPLVDAFCRFFKTGRPPVESEETLEIMAFMEAAEESLRQGGKRISIQETFEKARREKQVFIDVRLENNRTLLLDEKPVSLDRLSETIDSRARPDTRIKIILSAERDVDGDFLADVFRNLGKGSPACFFYHPPKPSH